VAAPPMSMMNARRLMGRTPPQAEGRTLPRPCGRTPLCITAKIAR
jgi:hypothetical protein